MNKKTRFLVSFGTAALFFLFMLNFPVSRLHSQSISLLTPPSIYGWVQLHPNLGEATPPTFGASLSIYNVSSPITMATVRVDDRFNIPHTGGGTYYLPSITYPALTFNMPIKISIKGPLHTEPEIFADGKVSALVDFISPTFRDVIDLRTTEYVKVQWKYSAGSATIEKLMLIRDPAGPSIEFTGIGAATHYEISRDRLAPNSFYRLILWVTLNDFRFKTPSLVSRRSKITLTMLVNTSFRTAS